MTKQEAANIIGCWITPWPSVLLDEEKRTALMMAVDALNEKEINRPVVLYGIENTRTGDITFSARGGAYFNREAAEKKRAKLGNGYRIVEYVLKGN